jgi:hypothetical protein
MSVKTKFDQAEIELLKEGLKRTYKERFEMATRLFKIQQTMTKAVISHKPNISKYLVICCLQEIRIILPLYNNAYLTANGKVMNIFK